MNTRPFRYMMLTAMLWSCNPAVSAEWLDPVGKEHETPPGFELKDLQDNIHTLPDYKGKVLLINFWASWCSACLREFPSLERLSRAFAGSHFALLAINVGENKRIAQRYDRLQDAGIEILLDENSSVAGHWNVKVYPTSFIVDANSRILGRVVGEMDWDRVDTHVYIRSLIADNKDK